MFTVGEGILSKSEFALELYTSLETFDIVVDNKKVEYYNIPAAFDIEVSSFYAGEKSPENKRAIMYIWQFGVNNLVVTGRTWDEFENFISLVQKIMSLNENRKLVVYVHNLPY